MIDRRFLALPLVLLACQKSGPGNAGGSTDTASDPPTTITDPCDAAEVCNGVDDDCDGTVDRVDGVGVCSQVFDANAVMDVLLVVDNSCGMWGPQQGLAANASGLFDPLVALGLDFHVGVVSTDMDDANHSGKLRQFTGIRWVDPLAPDPATLFAGMVQMGFTGSATEKGRDAIHAALDDQSAPGGWNDGFRRPDADLGVVVVSDENDFSTTETISSTTTFLQNQTSGQQLSFHAFVSPDPWCPGASMWGEDYVTMNEALGGIYWSICNYDAFAAPLQEAVEYRHLRFQLDAAPDPTTLAAQVRAPDGTVVDYNAGDLTLDERIVRLPAPAVGGAQVEIWYAPE